VSIEKQREAPLSGLPGDHYKSDFVQSHLLQPFPVQTESRDSVKVDNCIMVKVDNCVPPDSGGLGDLAALVTGYEVRVARAAGYEVRVARATGYEVGRLLRL